MHLAVGSASIDYATVTYIQVRILILSPRVDQAFFETHENSLFFGGFVDYSEVTVVYDKLISLANTRFESAGGPVWANLERKLFISYAY